MLVVIIVVVVAIVVVEQTNECYINKKTRKLNQLPGFFMDVFVRYFLLANRLS